MHAIALRTIDDINKALRQFGEYTYYDKGADEVFDVDALVAELRPLSGDEIGQILADVLTYEHGRPLVSSVLSALDGVEDEKWDAIMAYEGMEELY